MTNSLSSNMYFIPKSFSKKDMAVEVREVLDGSKDESL